MINKEAKVVRGGLLDDLGFDLDFERLICSGWAEETGKATEGPADHIGDPWSLNMEK